MITVTGLLHATIVTRDLPRLETFYVGLFNAKVLQRLDLDSPEFAAGTGVPNARAQTVHLMFADCLTVLEITQYADGVDTGRGRADVPGLRHIALGVTNMDEAVAVIREKGVEVLGGGPVRLVSPARVRGVSFMYILDPDGNIVELVDASRKLAAT